MELIRVIDNTEYCQQRLGFLKYLTWRCSSYGTTSLSTIGKDLVNTVSRKILIPISKNIVDYINKKRNYEEIKTTEKVKSDKDKITLELQDAYLADNSIPSKTGKLLPYAWEKYPYLAISLGLVRKISYSLLGKGQLLINLTDENEIKAFKEYNPENNPLIIDEKQKFLFIFLFFRYDGDVIKPLYSKALEMKEFSNRSLGDYLADIYFKIAKESRTKVRSGDDIEKIQRLIDKAKILERWKGKPDTGSRTARNKAIIVRIEPYVDLGLIEKKDPFLFHYQISESGYVIFSEFILSEKIEDFLNNKFFSTCNHAFKYNAKKDLTDSNLIPLFLDSYNKLKGPLGYASIEDVLLLAGIKAITEKRIYFELKEGENFLKDLQKKFPEQVRFNIDRMGKLTYIKFGSEFIYSIKSGRQWKGKI